MLSGRRLSRVQQYASELHLVLEARDRVQEQTERFRLALISHDPAKWLPIFYPEQHAKAKSEVTEEDIEHDVGVTFEFEQFHPEEAEDILAMAMASARSGSINEYDEERADGGWR